ncbi:MAG TPA: permease prefix domain 1-containing protein, partial [Terriglobia bacterium]|nr:permease prefix domain 1-containing protein [Terriglobia bacterium]
MHSLISRLSALFRRKRLDRELESELRAHLEMLRDDYLQRGLSPEEARYAAARAFGGVERVKEEYRSQRGLPMPEALAHDIRDAFRRFRTRPGFAVVAAVTMALGIGANTAIFSLLNTLLLRNLPVNHPEQLVEIGTTGPYRAPDPVSLPL